jgi:glycosyltransferase involved in cell wall biosynthesis
VKFSFVIPAHNEEALLGSTIDALQRSADDAGIAYELIVVNDGSTDRTAEIAAQRGGRVVSVNLRKISAVRNAGAREAIGDVLVFVDADTLVPAAVIAGAVQALREGAIGGGARVVLESNVPLWGRAFANLVIRLYQCTGYAGGCFLFARREAFEAAGGFDENYFATEEVHLSKALKRQGRFVIVREAVVTSGRKFRVFSPWAFLKLSAWFVLGGGLRTVRRREGLEMWYQAPREPARDAAEASDIR